MADIIITPDGKDAIRIGTILDDDGDRFAVMSFEQPGGDTVFVTMTVPLLSEFAAHVTQSAEAFAVEAYWHDHER
jgi:hypothetical protein